MDFEKEVKRLQQEHEKDLDCIMALTEQIEELNKKLENQKMNDLMLKKQELEKEIDKENYRIFMSTPRTPIQQEQKQEESRQRTLDEILLQD